MEMARKLSNDAFCYLLPLVNSSESGVSIRTERQRVSETYSYNEEETDLTVQTWSGSYLRFVMPNYSLQVNLRDTREHLKKIGVKT